MFRSFNLTAIAFLISFALPVNSAADDSGQGLAARTSAKAKLNIVATTGMVADLARAVAGDRGEVIGLMASGVDPHLYKPTRTDIARLTAADIVFYNGLLLEGKMTDALIRIATAGRKVFAVTDLIDENLLLEPPEFEGHFDPHLWMDPKTWSHTVVVVEKKLAELDPEGAEYYAANAQRYIQELKALDEYAEQVLSTVPEQSRVLVTAHDAFNYFGRRYGFEVRGIQGISTESEAGVKDIQELVDLLVSRKIPAVFVESTVSDRNIKALIEGAAAKRHRVSIGGELYSDAMGKSGSYRGTYLGMFDHNVTVIASALGGTVPVGGRTGRLTER